MLVVMDGSCVLSTNKQCERRNEIKMAGEHVKVLASIASAKTSIAFRSDDNLSMSVCSSTSSL